MENIEHIFERFQMDPYLLYDAITRSTEDYIYIVDMTTDEALVSENMVSDFELPGLLFHGLIPLWGELVHPRDKTLFFDSINDMLSGKTCWHDIEYQIQNRNGDYVWVLCRGLLKRDTHGTPTLFTGVVTNLGNKGRIDHTTGLFTQAECANTVQKLLDMQGANASGGILLLGLDNFSTINNLNNHIFGDMVLRNFAQTVQHYLPEDASIYRFDGDQFAIVCSGASKELLMELYGKIHIYFNRRHMIDDTSYCCTVSGGIAMLGRDADNYLDLIKYASSALTASKERGKNICTFFSPELIRSRLRNQELENRLHISVSDHMKGFHLVYQPIFNNKSDRVNEAEALLRWTYDDFNYISPMEFIPILESNGLIIPVGKWVLEQAIATCSDWVKAEDTFVMNINVSYLQLLETGFVAFFQQLLERYHLDTRHILLELTESYFVTDMHLLNDTFYSLRSMGVKIAMDDFGTGYSSLGMLSRLPADIVKIDRAFISMIDENHFNQSFIRSVIVLCHDVGIHVCVEGVERDKELQVIQELDADYIQGFYFSKPVGEEEFGIKFLC